MADDDVTLGELSRALAALEGRMNDRFGRIDRRLDDMQFVPREIFNVQMKTLEDRVDILEEAKKWIVRTLVSAFIFPVIVAAFLAAVVTR